MQTKLQMYQEVSEQASKRLWSDMDYFRSFLVTSARLYKYRFKDQMMIHDQRPNVVVCAEYDTWGREDIANRFVKRGSKGIALIDDSKDKTRLRYVFDFTDTSPRDERSKEPFFWSITQENRQLVGNALGSSTGSIDSCLISKAHEFARQYSADYSRELLNVTGGTFLEELDDFNVQVEFEQLLETSISYSLLSRCGYEPSAYFDEDDFRGIHDFNSTEAMSVLGTAVSDLSEQVLRTIERTLKDFERSKEYDRNDITQNNHIERNGVHSGRGNTDLSSEPERTGGRTNWQVRNAPQEVPQGEPQPVVSGDDDKGNAGRTSQGDRPEGTGYRAKTRFAKFFNLPKAHYHNVVIQPTEMQKEMVSELSERAKLIHEKLVAPEEDNMLKVTSDGRKIGLDQRMMNPLLADEAGTKVNICLENVHRIWEKTADRKSAQLVFCDFSTPKSDGSFNLYDGLRGKLVAKGVPKEKMDLDMSLSYDSFASEFHLDLQRDMTYSVTLGMSETGNVMRIDNALDSIEKLLENSTSQLESAKSELGKPFPQEV